MRLVGDSKLRFVVFVCGSSDAFCAGVFGWFCLLWSMSSGRCLLVLILLGWNSVMVSSRYVRLVLGALASLSVACMMLETVVLR